MTTVAEALGQANAHQAAGRLDDAAALCRLVLGTVPDHPDALHLLGIIAHRRGDAAGALDPIARAAARDPTRADLQHSLAIVLMSLRRFPEAEAALTRALSLDPKRRDAQFHLGRCRIEARDYATAAGHLRAELSRDPDHVPALMHLGLCAYELDRLEEAERCFRRVTALRPEDATGWNNVGVVLLERGDPEAAIAYYDAAAARDATYAETFSNRIRCEQYRVGVTPEGFLALAREWNARYAPAQTPPRPPRRAGTELWVGFASPELSRSPVGYFLIGLLESLDRSITTIVYSDTARADDMTQRLARAAGRWVETRGLDTAAFAQRVRGDGLDVLVDLTGHNKDNRLPAVAQRLARVQMTWAGYAGTTGVAAIDYLIADRFQVPEGADAFYSERVVRLPDDYVCYTPPDYAPEVAPLPAERTGRVTFGGFHNVAKIGTLSIDLWSAVLRAVPDSRLVLRYRRLDDPLASTRIGDAFAAAGVSPDRIVIEGTSAHIAMLQRYGDIDVALDSRPYSGGLTTCEALWMGVPVVTLPGRTFAGRHSLTHLMAVGLPQLVAKDEADYVRIAAGLAADRAALSQLRRSLRGQMARSPLCDAPRFARNFAAMLRIVSPA
ncbi:MAG TPA: tetratricopeptide repeat protein [Stellaceae bacterium]|nr:tetratricopeptide repeat protein [Stellaceae bacterium]